MIKRILAALMVFAMLLGCMPAPRANAVEIAPTASGTTYYVSSVHGAEGNSGTSQSAPFKSLLKINEITLQPGDRVLLERGSVFVDEYLHIKGSGSAEAPIIIDVYGDESLPKPLIQTNGQGVWYQDYGKRLDNINHQRMGNISSCILLYDVEYIEISSLAMTNEGNFAAGEVYNSAYRMDRTGVAGVAENIGTVDHIYLRDLDIRNVQGNVYNKHLCNGGIYLVCHQADDASTGVARYDDILIEGCRLDEVNRWGIAVGYTAYWDQIPYGPTIDPEVCKTYGSTNVVIRNNYLTNVGGDGITTMYCSEPLIEYNVLDGYCQDITDEIYVHEGNRGGQVAAGIWPWMCKSPVFQYNECYSSTYNQDAQAWDADWGDNAIYQYNYSCNNAGGAVMFCGQHACNTVFRYNISQNDLSGVLNLAGSPNGEIYNNVFYIKESVKINRTGMSGGRGNVISNNIFYYTGSAPAGAALGNWGDITAQWQNNIYYNYETIPADEYAITADPMFVDPGKGPSGAQASGLVHDRSAFDGYKVSPESPAINAGIPIADNGGLDFFGNELDLFPDIGVHEHGTFQGDAERAVVVDVDLGKTKTVTDLTGNYDGITPVVDNEKIASVAISGTSSTTRTRGNAVSTLTDGKYIVVNNRANKTLTNLDAAAQQGEAGTMAGLSLDGTKDNISDNAVWTITASGDGYTIRDAEGKYLSIVRNDANVISDESVVTVAYRNGTWTLSQDGAYLNDAANRAVCASGWDGDGIYDASTDAGSLWTIYPVTEETVSSTELTFTGLYPGTTNITVGDTLYIVRVRGELKEVNLEVGQTAEFTDLSGNYKNTDTDALDPAVATVELSGVMNEVFSTASKVTSLTSGSRYMLVNTRAGKPVTNAPATVNSARGLSLTGSKDNTTVAAIWTVTAVNGGYTIQDQNGKYMTVGSDSAGLTDDAATLTLSYRSGTWTISQNSAYLNDFGGNRTCAAGWVDWSAASDSGSQWDIYEVTSSVEENGTKIVFTAVGSGETDLRVGNTMYHITVTGGVHEHQYEAVVTEPTCTEGGYTTYTCECGDSYVADETAPLGHTEEVIPGKEATCTETGLTEGKKCSVCGVILVEQEEIPALDHTEEIIPGKEATCTETGLTEGKKCSVCGEIIVAQEEIPALGHDFVNGECSRCDAVKEAPFTDVPVGEFYFDPVEWAVEKGITTGASETTFNPGDNCLRGHVVTFLWRAAGSPEPTSNENPFSDVTENDFFYKAVLWAVENEITNGISATKFGPYTECNRAQVVTFLWRAQGKPTVTETDHPFTDVDADQFYYQPMLWAVENGITNGLTATTFGPGAVCNRAQVVTFLYRTMA